MPKKSSPWNAIENEGELHYTRPSVGRFLLETPLPYLCLQGLRVGVIFLNVNFFCELQVTTSLLEKKRMKRRKEMARKNAGRKKNVKRTGRTNVFERKIKR